MLPNRFRISKASAESLKILKTRTGVTPNVACRIALMLSLERGRMGGEREVDSEGSELYTHTLFGEAAQIGELLGSLPLMAAALLELHFRAIVRSCLNKAPILYNARADEDHSERARYENGHRS